jgi:predicted DCC family thiol-disulfide oxidoreductase YuxK
LSLQPILLFDGECGICRSWVSYWQRLTEGRVVYRPYQDAAAEFPAISAEAFARAIWLIEPEGQVYSGAAASYRVLSYAPGHGGWWWAYRHVPGFAAASERAYRFFAGHREFLGRVTRLLWGAVLEPERHTLASWLFLRFLGAIYVVAFASLAVQVLGLVGRDGVLPLGDYLSAARQGWGEAAFWRLPTLFWLASSDTALIAAAVAGVALGVLVLLNIGVRAALVGAFALYLSFVYAGQAFMNFQWDQLLLEAGFLAIFLTAGSPIVVWLYRFLVFRFLFLAGAVKLASGDRAWRSLSALDYHFWTQPLPTPLAWYAAALPRPLLAGATAGVLLIELGLVFLIWLPRRLRAIAGFAVLLFELLIMLTGNYNFFNLLTMALCVFLFDDAALRRVVPAPFAQRAKRREPRPGYAATATAALLALILVPAGLNRLWQPLAGSDLPLAGALSEAIAPLLIVNPYGLFAIMTTSRPEVILEGSDDGRTWREYVFRYMPGPVARAPPWCIAHQPRLDWQMWVVGYGGPAANPWVEALVQSLLRGSAPVLALLAANPFPEHPPKYLRAELYDYRFADAETHARTGEWWVRRLEGLYLPPVSLDTVSRPLKNLRAGEARTPRRAPARGKRRAGADRRSLRPTGGIRPRCSAR